LALAGKYFKRLDTPPSYRLPWAVVESFRPDNESKKFDRVSDVQRSENRGMSSLVLLAGTTVDIVADQCVTPV